MDQQTGDWKEDVKLFVNFILTISFTVVIHFILNGLYVGVICITSGIHTFQTPAGPQLNAL